MRSQYRTEYEAAIAKIKLEYNAAKSDYDNILKSKLEIIEAQKNKIITKYTNLQLELKQSYDTIIKNIDALYEAYEVTKAQLDAYNMIDNSIICKKLESTLAKFPKLSANRLCTNITVSKNFDILNFSSEFNIIVNLDLTLNYDIYNTPNSIFNTLFLEKISHPIIISDSGSYKITLEFDSSIYAYKIKLNDKCVRYVNAVVIRELDIIILHEYDSSNINFIQMSTGKLVYHERIVTQDISKFMYCNNTLIFAINDLNCLNITHYNIEYNISTMKVVRGSQYNVTYSTIGQHYIYQLSPICRFYGDSRGLYVSHGREFHFIGKLHDLMCNKHLSPVNMTKIYAIPKTTDMYDINSLKILSINYDTNKLLLMFSYYRKGRELIQQYHTVSFGFSDARKLF